MATNSVQFITSAADLEGVPAPTLPEVAMAGRSNAGKSSFINAIAGRAVAFVSQTPGKTNLLNFYKVGAHYFMVDMPGYGYASRSGGMTRSWQPLIEGYLTERETLKGVLLFIDSKRNWTDDENQLLHFCRAHGKSLAVVLTKMDRLNKAERAAQLKSFQAHLPDVETFFISSRTGEGVADLEKFIFKNWIRG